MKDLSKLKDLCDSENLCMTLMIPVNIILFVTFIAFVTLPTNIVLRALSAGAVNLLCGWLQALPRSVNNDII